MTLRSKLTGSFENLVEDLKFVNSCLVHCVPSDFNLLEDDLELLKKAKSKLKIVRKTEVLKSPWREEPHMETFYEVEMKECQE